jgi:hypothetical protein
MPAVFQNVGSAAKLGLHNLHGAKCNSCSFKISKHEKTMNVSRDDNGDIKLDSQDHSISFSFNRQITPEDKKSESTNKMISDVMNTPRSKKQVPMRELVLKTVKVFF